MADLKLPKNIRQVGEPSADKKIYVEDYVITYIRQLAAQCVEGYILGALLGRKQWVMGTEVMFISGAISLESQVTILRPELSDSHWALGEAIMKRYFPEAELMGWMLIRPGKPLMLDDGIRSLHRSRFPEKLICLVDASDKEEAFFTQEGQGFKRQPGYYIYYERNENMQNYMIENHQSQTIRDEDLADNISIPDFPQIKRVKRKTQENVKALKEKAVQSAQTVSKKKTFGISKAAMTTGVILLGLIALRRLQTPTNQGPADTTQTRTQMVETTQAVMAEVPTEFSTELSTESTTQVQTLGEQATDTTAETQAVAVDSPVQEVLRYTVEAGDTLAGISLRFYNDYAHIQMLAQENAIEDIDQIYPGMEIILP